MSDYTVPARRGWWVAAWKWLFGAMFGRVMDRLADDTVAEFQRLSHCHRCGACICHQHNALSDDTWDQHRVVCEGCAP